MKTVRVFCLGKLAVVEAETSYLYVLGFLPDGPFKIGYSLNPKQRADSIRTGWALPSKVAAMRHLKQRDVTLLKTVPCHASAAQSQEKSAHATLRGKHLCGEWFCTTQHEAEAAIEVASSVVVATPFRLAARPRARRMRPKAIGFRRDVLGRIDNWRRAQPRLPSQAEAVRLLVIEALDTFERSRGSIG